MVELRDFIAESIVSVLRGIRDAQQALDVGSLVAPKIEGAPKIEPSYDIASHDGKAWTVIKFDIAVTAEQTTENSGKLGLKIPVVGAEIGGGKKGTLSSQSVSRIQFGMHVQLPTI